MKGKLMVFFLTKICMQQYLSPAFANESCSSHANMFLQLIASCFKHMCIGVSMSAAMFTA